MIAPSPTPIFKPPATPYLASSPRDSALAAGSPVAGALFGAPLDLTETFRSGTHGAPEAVRAMSDALESYSPVLDRDLEDVALLDLGDLDLADCGMDAALDAIADGMALAMALAPLGIMIGGEHTASLGGFRGARRVYPDARLLQVDAHLDIREHYDGQRLSHATWLFHAGEEFGFGQIYQLGLRSGERSEWRTSRNRAALSSTELMLPPAVRASLEGVPIYLSIDIDVLDPGHAPGTGCPEPGGVTFRELAAFLYSLACLRVVGLDVMEVSPNLDPANITAAAAAKLVREAVLLFGAPWARASAATL